MILPGTIGHLVKRVIFKAEVNNETKKKNQQLQLSATTIQSNLKNRYWRLAFSYIVAVDLGLSESLLYSWRSKLRQTNLCLNAQ